MDKVIFSIIVPVYQVEKFIPHCIESIISQTFHKWELILVDDGSIDKSGIICDDYAQKDVRIKVIHKPNGGVSTARNAGLDNVLGEWVTFVDSDDYVDADWLEQVHNKIQEGFADIYTWGNYYNEGDKEWRLHYVPENIMYKNSTEFIQSKSYRHGPVWYMYKKEWIERFNCRFPEGIKRSEDQCFLLQYFSHNPRISTIPHAFYHYVKNPQSVTQRPFSINDVADNLHVALIFAEYARRFDSIDERFILIGTRALFNDYISYLKEIGKTNDSHAQDIFREKYKEICKLFPAFRKECFLYIAYHSIPFALFEQKIKKIIYKLFP